jgi:hypothetical protein
LVKANQRAKDSSNSHPNDGFNMPFWLLQAKKDPQDHRFLRAYLGVISPLSSEFGALLCNRFSTTAMDRSVEDNC